MRRFVTSLIVCLGAASASALPTVLSAESSTEIAALSAEVKALKARQLAIQARLESIQALLTGERQTGEDPARLVREPSQAEASTAEPLVGDADIEACRRELEEMKTIVAGCKKREEQARLARLPVRDIDFTLQVGEDPFKGSTDARVTLVEFTDFQCSFCKRHNKNVLPDLIKNFVEPGKVRYVLRDYPLDFHKDAAKAHEAAHCAGEQGEYWEMSEQLFANQNALTEDKLLHYAEAAGVADTAAFLTCLESGQYAARGQQSLAEGAKAGVRGTPSFLLGLIGADGSTVTAKKFIRGAQKYEVFEKAINEMLAATKG